MVWFAMHIERGVWWFGVWLKFLCAQIQGNVREVDTLGSRGYFFLIDISRRSRVNEAQSAEEKKITSGHRSTQPHFHARNQFRNWTGSPIGYSHVQLFDAANQGHCYIVNSLRTWEYPIGDPVQFLNWFLAWKWGCVLLWPEVIFFSSALCASLTRLRREISIRKKYPLEPRVGSWWLFCLLRWWFSGRTFEIFCIFLSLSSPLPLESVEGLLARRPC